MIHLSITFMLAVSFAASSGLACYGYRYRGRYEVRLFLLLMLCYAFLSSCCLLILSAGDLESKILFSRLKYIGFAFATPIWLLLATHFFDRARWLHRKWALPLLFGIPIAATICTLTPSLQDQFVTDFAPLVAHGLSVVSFQHGPFFNVYLTHAYLMHATSFGVALVTLVRGPPLRRKQAKILLAFCVVPLAVDISGMWTGLPSRWFLLSASSTSLIGIGVTIAIFRGRLMNLSPLAKAHAFEGVTDPIVVFDGNLHLHELNQAAASLLQVSDSAIGVPMAKCLSEKFIVGFEKAIHDPGSKHEWELSTDEAHPRVFTIRAEALRLSREEKGFLVALHDITPQKRLEQHLQRLGSFKAKLLALISHDLTGNFKNFSIVSTALRDQLKTQLATDQRLKKSFDLMVDSALATQDLLTNLLRWTKTQDGEFRLNATAFEMNTLIRGCVQSMAAVAQAKDVQLTFQASMPLIFAHGDVEMIATVVRNLLSNAIRFSKSSGVVAIATEHGAAEVRITIRDDGPGLSSEQLEAILKRSSLESTNGGFGVGLKICDELLSLHRGRLWARQPQDGGSLIGFSLPSMLSEGAL